MAGQYSGIVNLVLEKGSGNQAEVIVAFDLPSTAETLTVSIGNGTGTTVERHVVV